MIRVWNECIERGKYTLDGWLIQAIVGRVDAAEHLVNSDLVTAAGENRFRVRGTKGRVEYLERKRRIGKATGHLGAEHGKKGGRPPKTRSTGLGNPVNGLSGNPPPTPAPAPAPAQKTKEKESASQSDGEAPPPAATKPDETAVEAKPKKPRKTPDSPHHRSIAVFTDGWRQRYGETYPFNAGKDAEAFKAMLAHVSGDEAKLAAVIGRYLADDDEFAAKARHSIGVLRSQFAKWLVDAPPVASRPPSRGGFETPQDRIRANLIDVCEDEP